MRPLPLIVALLTAAACTPSPTPPSRLVLWAWERPEDLRFLAPDEAEIALLVNRIVLRESRVEAHPRAQPLQALSGITVTPVVRIEAVKPTLDAAQLEELLETIRRSTLDSRFQGLQIDFDAAQSQHAFYRELLDRLRPDYDPLSMTALVSWCAEPSWLDGLPVNEIVPMLFRMGPGADVWIERLERDQSFAFAGCNGSLGTATDEPLRWQPASERLYLFHPRPWSQQAFAEAVSRLH